MNPLFRGRASNRRAWRRFSFVWAALVAVGCAPTHHTPPPYGEDPLAAKALEEKATALCAARTEVPSTEPQRPFVTDGCSAWPDGERYVHCCVEHDVLYWCGGSAEERRAADDAFGRCVAENTSAFLGGWMRWGVRMGGHPVFPTHYRWGYGLEYSFGYPSASSAE